VLPVSLHEHELELQEGEEVSGWTWVLSVWFVAVCCRVLSVVTYELELQEGVEWPHDLAALGVLCQGMLHCDAVCCSVLPFLNLIDCLALKKIFHQQV